MAAINPFTEKFKTLTNAQLVAVIDTPENYQPHAVSAAEAELAMRSISTEELTAIRSERQALEDEKAIKAERARILENKVRQAGAEFATFVQPNVAPTQLNKTIVLISIIFGSFGIYQVYLLIKDFIDTITYHMPFFYSVMMPVIFQA